MYEVSSDWDESTLVWNDNQTVGTLIASKDYPAQYSDVSFDVTSYVAGEVASGADYVSFRLSAISVYEDGVLKFYSREWASEAVWPSLEFGYVGL